MHEHVVSAFALNEAKTLGCIEPLDKTFLPHKQKPPLSLLCVCSNSGASTTNGSRGDQFQYGDQENQTHISLPRFGVAVHNFWPRSRPLTWPPGQLNLVPKRGTISGTGRSTNGLL